ncbi:hypothetical protein BED47_14665 [Gottfriedia luciferensis]|uniref:Uncharacterized protein n=1 Tax=Gottfriedia luciferensis TaxID=178774 RepID=A0ABX2ZIW0_9BACI|nr:hypothetical protein BED47_14665 [Gottfriedia luciferensis]
MKEILIFVLLSFFCFLFIYILTLLQGFDLHYLTLALSYNKVGFLTLDKIMVGYFILYFCLTMVLKLRKG